MNIKTSYTKQDFKEYKKNRLHNGYDNFKGNYIDWLKHELIFVKGSDDILENKCEQILKKKINVLEKASSESLSYFRTQYLLKLMQENEKEIEDLILQNIGFKDELSRRSLK